MYVWFSNWFWYKKIITIYAKYHVYMCGCDLCVGVWLTVI